MTLRTFFAAAAALSTTGASVFGVATAGALNHGDLQVAVTGTWITSVLTLFAAASIEAYRWEAAWQRFQQWKPDEEMTAADRKRWREQRSRQTILNKISSELITDTLSIIKITAGCVAMSTAAILAYNSQFPSFKCAGDEKRRTAQVQSLPNGEAYLSTRLEAPYAINAPLLQVRDYILPDFSQARRAARSFCDSATAPETAPLRATGISLEIAP